MNYLMYSNSNSNSFELSYDLRVTSFFYLSDPPPSYEFDNIDYGYNVYHYEWQWEYQVQLLEPEGTEDLALEESHPVDDGKTDDDCKLEEVVEEENL